MTEVPSELPADLAEALERAANAERLLVASDFDGTLAPFVHDPMAARALPGTLDDLIALAGMEDTHAAIVSGRDLETLKELTNFGGDFVTLIGSHGGESSRSEAAATVDHELLAALVAEVEAQVAEEAPEVRLEYKPSAIVLHTRGLAGPEVSAAEAIAERAATRPGVLLLTGKNVLELTVAAADKGSAIRALADDLEVDTLVFFGDDVTDEHGFEVLREGDIGVKVGEGETAAAYRVARCDDVATALRTLRDLRDAP
ncbi:trehalose-phosphatase [Janibacter sp. GXQ6167]|uniref:trehalose-phosphatase n=1 Tax=Janibacter sp. GXQ6167 TaxID=3240791 RepID=UPI003523FE2B